METVVSPELLYGECAALRGIRVNRHLKLVKLILAFPSEHTLIHL